jgi:hypothetical protein
MMSLRVGYLLLGIAVLAACGLAGCGGASDQLPREPISGTVTFDGRPLKSGSIRFTPVQTKEGIATGGMITDGRFDVARDDGPVPGNYQVMIFADGGSQAAARPDPSEPTGPGLKSAMPQKRTQAEPTAGLIPLRYNLKSELTAEVKAGGPNRYTFDLQK